MTRRIRIEVEYRIDGVMRTDVIKTTGRHYSISRPRGYVHVRGETRLYRRIERIIVTETIERSKTKRQQTKR